MTRLFLALLLLVFPLAAHAQTAMPVTPGYMATQCSGIGPCFVPTADGVVAVKGFGTLAVTGTSALVSTLTVGPGSAAWPTVPGLVRFMNTGTTTLFLCPLGGTCSATTGIPIAAAATLAIFNPSTSTTVIDATTGTLVAQW